MRRKYTMREQSQIRKPRHRDPANPARLCSRKSKEYGERWGRGWGRGRRKEKGRGKERERDRKKKELRVGLLETGYYIKRVETDHGNLLAWL